MPKVKAYNYKCERCGHEWAPRKYKDSPPNLCPKCKSVQWDVKKEIKAE